MTAIPQLLQIMAEAETLQSKRKVDETLNTIIEQSGSLVSHLFILCLVNLMFKSVDSSIYDHHHSAYPSIL